jgi:hypothetical protein
VIVFGGHSRVQGTAAIGTDALQVDAGAALRKELHNLVVALGSGGNQGGVAIRVEGV